MSELARVADQLAVIAADPGPEVEDVAARSTVVAGDEFLFAESVNPAPIWGDESDCLWPTGESLFVVAPIGVGKTTLAGQIVRARIGIGDGQVLGYPVESTPDRRVLYIAGDRPSQIRRSFRRMIDEADAEIVRDRLIFHKGPLPFDLGREPHLLAEYAQEHGATDLVIDSLKDVAADLSKDETGSRVNNALQVCLAAGIEVAVLHHQRKAGAGNTKPKTLHDVYGSIWPPAGAGSVLLLWGEPGDAVVEVSHLKAPADQMQPLDVLVDFDSGQMTRHNVVDAYGLLKIHGTLTAQQLAKEMFGGTAPNQMQKARRQLEKLVKRQVATRSDSFGQNPAVYSFVGGGVS